MSKKGKAENFKGKDFAAHPERINRKGRAKKIYTILKEKGFGADDIKTAMGEMAFYTVTELSEVYKDLSKPVIARIVANQYEQALVKSDWNRIKEILEHTIGRPSQSIVMDSKVSVDPEDKERVRKQTDEIIDAIKSKKSKYGDA